MNRLIDQWMPEFGANEIHSTRVNASQSTTYAAIRTANLADSAIVRTLLAARALPAALSSGSVSELRRRASQRITLDSFGKSGFRILEENAPAEIVIGLQGRFWTPTGGVSHCDAEVFGKPIPANVVRAMWNFTIDPLDANACEITTETRIHWTDPDAGRSFMRYWRVVGPFSGLIRTFMLRAIKEEAEKR